VGIEERFYLRGRRATALDHDATKATKITKGDGDNRAAAKPPCLRTFVTS
jgi:hypothetical protein